MITKPDLLQIVENLLISYNCMDTQPDTIDRNMQLAKVMTEHIWEAIKGGKN